MKATKVTSVKGEEKGLFKSQQERWMREGIDNGYYNKLEKRNKCPCSEVKWSAVGELTSGSFNMSTEETDGVWDEKADCPDLSSAHSMYHYTLYEYYIFNM